MTTQIQTASVCDMACQILSATKDGNHLAPRHLSLLQDAINGELNQTGMSMFSDLHRQVCITRTYDHTKQWLYDIEHLTRDHVGYVYWKGISVEHFSFHVMSYKEALNSATRLAHDCITLELEGKPVCHQELFALYDRQRKAGTRPIFK